MDKKSIVAGNWKMNKTHKEASEFIKNLAPLIQSARASAYIAPSFTALHDSITAAKDTNIIIGAQNMHDETDGAFTGEISGGMLKTLGIEFVILGHSERRHVIGEPDELIRKKVIRAKDEGLIPVLCIGEKLEEREKGITEQVNSKQLTECLKDIAFNSAQEFVIAYEPVWAIGTGKTATPEQAQEVHAFVRELIGEMYGNTIRDEIQVLYGGSVNPGNASELLSLPDIDGALVGGASLKINDFVGIIESV